MDAKEAQPEKQGAPQNTDNTPPPTVIANSAKNKKHENRENDSKTKHKPTERVAWPAKVQAICAILLVVITLVYTYYTRGQVISASKATTETLRPWIKIESISLRHGSGPITTLLFHFPGKNGLVNPMLQISVSIENVGRSVARDIQIIPIMYFGETLTDEWVANVSNEENLVCGANAKSYHPEGVGVVVFPSDHYTQMGGTGALLPKENAAPAVVLVCVGYSGEPGTHYQTQAWSSLYEFNNALIVKGMDVDARDLRLFRSPSGDHAY
jgi:hypothetical protein